MYCPICGEKIEDNKSKCDKCGATLVVTAYNKDETDPDNNPTDDNKKLVDEQTKSRFIKIVILYVLAISGLILTYWYVGVILCILCLILAFIWKQKMPYAMVNSSVKYASRIATIGIVIFVLICALKLFFCNAKNQAINTINETQYSQSQNVTDNSTISSEVESQLNKKYNFIKENTKD